MNNDVLVSVIVPVYNVENYLAECLDSILNQKYKNIEVLIVNDGTPDSSGDIADRFSLFDERVKVFHRANQGVSYARNFGLSIASGKFVVFVDSDDVILPNYIDYMLTIAISTGADFCMSTGVATNKKTGYTLDNSFKILSPEEATCSLLYPEIVIGCWNKIYRTCFLIDKNITFPTDFYMGEGLNFITTVSQLSNKIGVGNQKLYYYRTNNVDSATSKFSINNIKNAFKAISNIDNKLFLKTPKVRKALDFHLWWTYFYALQSVIAADKQKKYFNELKSYSFFLKSNALNMLKSDVSKKMKIKIILIWIAPVRIVNLSILLRNNKL